MVRYEVEKWIMRVFHEIKIILMICISYVHVLRHFEIKTIVIFDRNLKSMDQSPVLNTTTIHWAYDI